MSERTLFLQALEIADPARRAAFLDQECVRDPALRQRIERLLAAHAAAGGILDKPPLKDPPTELVRHSESPGAVIGPYKLLQQLGEGGMGVVYMAEQHEPVERRVALKIIRPGMDSQQIIARFEAERQALAMMDHPNIAKVFDAGTTDSHRPYFVMELVKGVPITRYCDEKHLSVRERLDLMVPVCQAIQHAHQKGIIHRDIKPSNILVALYDGQPVPKVIDFGVAKATGPRLTDRTMFTQFGQVVGTLEYMSPEQAELNQLDIDTRSDIYSLGVLLYELLTGSTPFDRKRLQSAAFDEMLRIIREEEPPKPSTKLSTIDTLPSVAANRGVEPTSLTKSLRGELDWIVMKALEKDRNRRYETASGLALDLIRFLKDEPVQACPPSRAYRLRKFVRRYRRALLATALIFAMLVCGIVGTTVGLVRARQAEARARALAADERQARQQEAIERRQAEAVSDLLESVFQDLNPRRQQQEGSDLRTQLLEQLDQAADHLETQDSLDPVTRARMRKALAVALVGSGSTEKAVALLEKARREYETALGPDHHDTLSVRHRLGNAYQDAGRLDDAIRLYEETLRRCESKLSPDDPDTLNARANLATAYRSAGRAAEAIRLNEEVLKIREAKLGPDHVDVLRSRLNLGVALRDADRYSEAIEMHEETARRCTARFGADHHLTLIVRNDLAIAYRKVKRLADAIGQHEQVLKARATRLGVDHPDTLTSRNSLAAAYLDAGRVAEAIKLHEENLPLREARLGLDHPGTIATVHNLAVAYVSAGQFDKAIPLHERALAGQTARFGPDHPDTLGDASDLATAYSRADQPDKAIPLFEQTLERQTAKLGGTHPATLKSTYNLAATYQKARQFEQAEPLLRKVLAYVQEKGPFEGRTADQLLSNVGANLLLQGRPAAAEPLFRECLEIHVQQRPDEWPRFRTLTQLGASLLGQKRYAEAEPLLLEGYAGLNQRAGKIPANLRTSHLVSASKWLTDLYEAWAKPDEAAQWRKTWESHRNTGSKTPPNASDP